MSDLSRAPRPDVRPDGDRRVRGAGGRGHWALRDQPALLWLLLAVVMTVIHPWVPSRAG